MGAHIDTHPSVSYIKQKIKPIMLFLHLKIIPGFHSAGSMGPQVSCHSPALHVILLVIPLQSGQKQRPWARNSPSQIPGLPLSSASQPAPCPRSLAIIFELLLLCPAPAQGPQRDPNQWRKGGIKWQPTRL